jgi:hypothetical protein
MTIKADAIREEINVTTKQVHELNQKLVAQFKTGHHGGMPMTVDCTGSSVRFDAPGTPMENIEAIRMARWMIDMLTEDGACERHKPTCLKCGSTFQGSQERFRTIACGCGHEFVSERVVTFVSQT